MRNISSTVLSLAAMVLSSLTTYLTFFDSRYTLTAAVADTDGRVSRGYGSNGETKNVNYRIWTDNSLVLSNRGTRSLVVSDIWVVLSDSTSKCVANEDSKKFQVQQYIPPEYMKTEYIRPFIVEPGSVAAMQISNPLQNIDQDIAADEEFVFDPIEQLWCYEWTVFDPNGKRHESLMPALKLNVQFVTEEGENYPDAQMKLDAYEGPNELLSRGLF